MRTSANLLLSLQTTRLCLIFRASIEAIIAAMVVFSPWAFGSVHPASILVLYAGLSISLVLWAAVICLEQRVRIRNCPVFFCFVGMVLLGVVQLAPLNSTSLALLSPGTASLRQDLIPEKAEALIGEDPVAPPSWTISLDPNATREKVVQLLGLMALFAVVRFAIASPTSFRRFALVCTINGALLSLFALAQHFSDPERKLFWLYPTRQGAGFGPFVCRNNFPDYVNVCIGLGVGLFFSTQAMRSRSQTLADRALELGRRPAMLWLIAALVFMATGVLFSLSRGGAIGLAAAVGCFLLLAVRSGKINASVGMLTIVAAFALGSIAFLGAGVIGQRLSTIAERDSDEGRVEMWMRVLPLVRHFPLWGTGFGTFVSVEPQTRQPGGDRLLDWENAHNDYLECLIEGGAIELALLLLIIFFVFQRGIRGLSRLGDAPQAATVIGSLAGFTAVLVHSFGDFGAHIPAVALLLTVLIAHLSARSEDPITATRPVERWLALPAISACIIVAVVLPLDGWFRERAEFYKLAAIRANNRLAPGEKEPVIRYLETAASYSPTDALIRLRLAEAEYEEFLIHRARPGLSPIERNELIENYLRPALRNYLRLRAANPFYSQSHGRLAGNREFLQHADSVKHYLDRATRVRPTDEGLWYLAGLDRLAHEAPDDAWESWRKSLICSPIHLPSILPAALARLGPIQTVDRVFPASPELLLQAARTPPLSQEQDDLRAFAARASDRIADLALEQREQLHARAWLFRQSGRRSEAIRAYEKALVKFPNSSEYRLELAECYFEAGDIHKAEEHLSEVLRSKPDLAGAKELHRAILKGRMGIE